MLQDRREDKWSLVRKSTTTLLRTTKIQKLNIEKNRKKNYLTFANQACQLMTY